MESNKDSAVKIACCIPEELLEALRDAARDAAVDLAVEEKPNVSGLIGFTDENAVDCVLYEVKKNKAAQKDYVKLCGSGAKHHTPILLLADNDVCEKLRGEIQEAGYSYVYVMANTSKMLFHAVAGLVRAHRVEGTLRSVNQRLVEVVEDHARAMHESEELYRFLFNACSDAIMVLEVDRNGANGVLKEVNEVAVKWFGYVRDHGAEFSLNQLFSFSNHNKASNKVDSILKRKEMFFETMMQRKDGTKIPVEVITRTFALEGERYRVIILARLFDHSTPGQGKDEASEDYRFMASQTGLLMYDGNLKTQQMILGGAVTEITGYPAQQIMRLGMKGWRERIVSEDYHRVVATINHATRKLDKYEVEYRIVHKSGDIRYIEDHGVVLPDESGTAVRILGTMKDITLRVQAEEQRQHLENELQHSQRLESLGVLAGGIAHDFNNILAGIIGLTDLALREVPVDTFVHEDLTEVLQAANRAKELVRQILAFSRQSGQERSPIYLHIVAREVIKLLRASLPPNIEIIDCADVHSGAVLANAAQMYQVITNFSTNAAQAMVNKSGTIEVRVQDIDLDENDARKYPGLKPGPYVQLSVMDSGHGMSESVLARVFDPFFTTKGPGEGTGMGLAVVHGIITDHGGAVSAMSKLGAGSRFDAFLPRIAGVQVEENGPQESLPKGHERILFVDDDAAVLHFAESALPRLGFKVTMCRDGEEGLNTFLQHAVDFDLVITDQIMPKMSGLDLAKEIHLNSPRMPIILFTGFSDEILPSALAESGIREVVFKPIITKDLIKAIRRAVDQDRKPASPPKNP